jgi:hypothetical protein
LETIAAFRFLIQADDLFFAELFKRHFDHSHGAFDDHLARVDDGRRLLPLQHSRGNLGRVRQVGDSGLQNLKPAISVFSWISALIFAAISWLLPRSVFSLSSPETSYG